MNNRITIDPKVLVGKPIIKGTRIPVHLVINLLNHGYDVARICEAYPVLKPADIRAVLEYSEDILSGEYLYTPAEISYA